MAVGFRPNLGVGLQNIVAGDEYPVPGAGPFGTQPHNLPQSEQSKGGFFKDGGLGRLLAGAIGDALLQNAGMAPVYAPMQRQRQQMAAEEAIWSRRRQAENEDWRARQDYEAAHRPDDDFTRMIRAAGIDPASEQGKLLYNQRIQRQVAEPDVITTLPNGQLYAGPRSGLAAALTGQLAPVATPVGKLTPIPEGGPAATPGTFPR